MAPSEVNEVNEGHVDGTVRRTDGTVQRTRSLSQKRNWALSPDFAKGLVR